jgi:peptide/nickel transport system ATP-binding protein/oligopeptide transport system ATP-binding protein
MQVIFQDPGSSFDPRWTVESIVAEPLAVQGIFRRRAGRALRVAELLRQVGLPDAVMSRYPHEFSGGQRQRIAIARALATRPRFIVADEPFSALDVSVQAQLLNLLADLQQSQGLAYLLVSHDVSILLHLAHRVAVMYLGQIIEECSAERLALGARGGSPDQADVTASPTRRDPHPLHPYTEGLLTAMPTRDPADSGVAQPLAGDAPSPIAPPSGCAFHPRCPLYRDRRNSACVHRSPPLEDVAPGHRVACHELRRAKSLDSSSPPG